MEQYAICDEEDFDQLTKHRWNLSKAGYVQTMIRRKTFFMSRYVKFEIQKEEIVDGCVVDHVNRNKLDNRRCNLQIVTQKENLNNKTKKKGASSRFYGVTKCGNKFRSIYYTNGMEKHIGRFDDELVAARYYDRALLDNNNITDRLKLKLNFPDTIDETMQLQPIVHRKYKRKNGNKTIKKIKTEKIDIDMETIKLVLNNKDMECLIDAEDYDKVKYCNIHVNNGYIKIKTEDKKRMLLSRYLMNANDPKVFIDHIDHNPFNMKKSNLRFSNSKRNGENKKKRDGTTSKYLGVAITKGRPGFLAQVKDQNYQERKWFDSEEYAARYRDLMIRKNLPESHYEMNFKDWTPEREQEWQDIFDSLPKKKRKVNSE